MEFIAKDLGEAYPDLLKVVLDNGELVSPRGMKVLEVRPLTFRLTDPTRSLVDRPGLNMALIYAECMMILSGKFDLQLIYDISPNAASLMDPRGAYGPRVYHQYEEVLKELIHDRDSRRAIITISHDLDLYDSVRGVPDQPCTISWAFMIRNNKLEMFTNMRSWDLVWGLTTDIPVFTTVQRVLARALNVGVGVYTHTAWSAHIYERHWDILDKVSSTPNRILEDFGLTSLSGSLDHARTVQAAISSRDFGSIDPISPWVPASTVLKEVLSSHPINSQD